MARPLSPITKAVRDVLVARGEEPSTWRAVAHELARRCVINAAAPSEVRLVRNTVFNMAARGELRPMGVVATPGSCRPMVGWVLCQERQPVRASREGRDRVAQALSHILQAWAA